MKMNASEYLSEQGKVLPCLGIRVGIPHWTKFNVGWVRFWGLREGAACPGG